MIRVENSRLPVVAQTHPGMKGKNNEDSYGVAAFQTEKQPSEQVLLAVLSDGIGGHRAGEVASELAVDVISQFVAESDGSSPTVILQEAIHLASDTIQQQAQEIGEQQGMGATCACAWIAGDRLFTATVGDSRIYLMRSNQIYQLSIDHTWIQEALEMGLIQPDQVNGHPNAHVIRRYLGSPTQPEVDFRMRLHEGETDTQSLNNQGVRLLPNDRLLLCSDGLTDLVSDAEILAAYREKASEQATAYLVDLANQRGGHDNITLVTVQFPPALAQAAKGSRKRKILPGTVATSRLLVIGCIGAILLGLLAGGLFGGLLIFNRSASATPTQASTLLQPSQTAPLRLTSTPTRAITATLALALPSVTAAATRTNPPPGPSLTPWPTNTPGTPLPVVTVLSP